MSWLWGIGLGLWEKKGRLDEEGLGLTWRLGVVSFTMVEGTGGGLLGDSERRIGLYCMYVLRQVCWCVCMHQCM